MASVAGHAAINDRISGDGHAGRSRVAAHEVRDQPGELLGRAAGPVAAVDLDVVRSRQRASSARRPRAAGTQPVASGRPAGPAIDVRQGSGSEARKDVGAVEVDAVARRSCRTSRAPGPAACESGRQAPTSRAAPRSRQPIAPGGRRPGRCRVPAVRHRGSRPAGCQADPERRPARGWSAPEAATQRPSGRVPRLGGARRPSRRSRPSRVRPGADASAAGQVVEPAIRSSTGPRASYDARATRRSDSTTAHARSDHVPCTGRRAPADRLRAPVTSGDPEDRRRARARDAARAPRTPYSLDSHEGERWPPVRDPVSLRR